LWKYRAAHAIAQRHSAGQPRTEERWCIKLFKNCSMSVKRKEREHNLSDQVRKTTQEIDNQNSPLPISPEEACRYRTEGSETFMVNGCQADKT